MPSVLFVCTYNQFRSPLAAAFFRQILEEKGESEQWHVGSAGTWALENLSIAPLANQAALKYGIDLNTHRTNLINSSLLLKYDLVLVMESGQKEAIQYEFPPVQNRIFLISEITEKISYDISDPAQFDAIMALNLADDLYDLIRRGYKSIIQLAKKISKNRQ
jgi:protein-tyrosine phosphatase